MIFNKFLSLVFGFPATIIISYCLESMGKLISTIALVLSMSVYTYSQDIVPVDGSGLAKLLVKNTDTVYVINFWATWCSPCVEEIGYFEELHKSATGSKLQVLLINLDFPNQVEERVKPFITEKKLTAPVLNMQDLDYNRWIPNVDNTWTGAIPATLIYKKDKRKFYPAALSKKELFEAVDKFKEY